MSTSLTSLPRYGLNAIASGELNLGVGGRAWPASLVADGKCSHLPARVKFETYPWLPLCGAVVASQARDLPHPERAVVWSTRY